MHASRAGESRRRTGRPAGWRRAAAAAVVLAAAALAPAPAATQATIQYGPLIVPGATEVLNPVGVNAAGQVIVNYMDATYHVRAALIDAKGNVTPIVVPGAYQTLVYAINNAGQIVGSYYTYQFTTHGFYRDPAGAYSTVDYAGDASSQTQAMDINDLGQIVGSYYSPTGEHGFLRGANGQYTTIDAPHPGSGFLYTVAAAVNNFSQVAGYYYGTSGASTTVSLHGFLRNADGTYITVDYPTTPPAVAFTSVTGLNDLGQIVGLTYSPAYHGFLTDAGGQFTPIDYPTTASYYFSTPWAVNGAGMIAGTYRDGAGLHGFTAQALAAQLPPAPAGRRAAAAGTGALRTLQSALCLRDQVESFFDDAAPVGGVSAVAEASRRVDLFTTDAVPFIGLVALEALGYEYLGCVQNASDPSFTTKVAPELHGLPPIPSGGGISAPLGTALTDTVGHGSRAAGHLQAVSVSLNRYRAAVAAGDGTSASLQESAVLDFAQSAGDELAAFAAGLRTSAGLIQGTALDESVSRGDLAAALARIRAQGAQGLPAIEQGGFRMFELDPSYLLTGGRGAKHDDSRLAASLSRALMETARVMDRLGRALGGIRAHH
ncbi:MAG TPA: hypothetical protein VKW09_01105 [bacterium]|nr:hypothetical protein [bacterium]